MRIIFFVPLNRFLSESIEQCGIKIILFITIIRYIVIGIGIDIFCKITRSLQQKGAEITFFCLTLISSPIFFIYLIIIEKRNYVIKIIRICIQPVISKK
jgi:hypothetical protein